jgi:hypothetical protein
MIKQLDILKLMKNDKSKKSKKIKDGVAELVHARVCKTR